MLRRPLPSRGDLGLSDPDVRRRRLGLGSGARSPTQADDLAAERLDRLHGVGVDVAQRAFGAWTWYSADAGSCTSARPPVFLIAQRPAVPSSSMPERTTPMTRGPNATDAERNSASTEGRCRFSRWSARDALRRLGSMIRCRSAGATKDLAANERLAVDRGADREARAAAAEGVRARLSCAPECGGPRTRRASRSAGRSRTSTPRALRRRRRKRRSLTNGDSSRSTARAGTCSPRMTAGRATKASSARCTSRNRRCPPARRRRRNRPGCAPRGRWRCRRCCIVAHDPVAARAGAASSTRQQAPRLRDVAVARALVLEVLAGELVEEADLAEHRADAAHLEHQPLQRLVAAGGVARHELPVFSAR